MCSALAEVLDGLLPRKPISLVAMDSFAAFRGGRGADSTVDLSYIHTQARFHAAVGVDMVILQGTQGEWPSLTVEERLDMASAWRKCVPVGSKLKLLLHVGHDSLPECKRLAEHAVALQMDAILISAPSKFVAQTMSHQADTVVEILRWCGGIPAFYYHYPALYHDDFDVWELLTAITLRAELADVQTNLVGAKLSIGAEPAGELVKAFSASGEGWGLGVVPLDPVEYWSLPAMRTVIVHSWEAPLWRKAIDIWLKGDHAKAAVLSDKIYATRKLASMKALANALGFNYGLPRLPLVESSREIATLAAAGVRRLMEEEEKAGGLVPPDWSLLCTSMSPKL